MKSYRKELWFEVPTRRAFINITPKVEECLKESGIEEGLVLVECLADEQFEAGVSGLKSVAFVLQFAHALQDMLQILRALVQVELAAHCRDDVAPPGKLADQHAPRIAHQFRRDVLIR